jgi:hypothetical protein
MTQGLRRPERGRDGAWIAALGLALALAIQPLWSDSVAAGVTFAIALTLLAALRWRLRWLPVVVLVGSGILLRVSMLAHRASDVSAVTGAAISVVLHGGNPYGFGYGVSVPPGAGFPYGPVDLLWYLPTRLAPNRMELLVSVLILLGLGLLALRGKPIGLAVYAIAPPLVLATIDGSNDTSAGFLILVSLVVAARRPAIGAGLLAIAVAFKPYALAWAPPLALWAGLPSIAAFVGVSLVAWSPVLFVWGVGPYLESLALAAHAHLHNAYWSLAAVWDALDPGGAPHALETLRYIPSGAIAVLGARRVRSLDGVIVVGLLSFLVAQFLGYFGSFVYLGAVAPIVCWRLDDWLATAIPGLVAAVPERRSPDGDRGGLAGAGGELPGGQPRLAWRGPVRGGALPFSAVPELGLARVGRARLASHPGSVDGPSWGPPRDPSRSSSRRSAGSRRPAGDHGAGRRGRDSRIAGTTES